MHIILTYLSLQKFNLIQYFLVFINFKCMILSFHCMQIVLENIMKFDILIHFDVMIETAPNSNKTKCFFLLFCWINLGDILNFKSARLKVNSLTFYKNDFNIEIASTRIFSVNGGQARLRLRGPGRARTPFHRKNLFWNNIQN